MRQLLVLVALALLAMFTYSKASYNPHAQDLTGPPEAGSGGIDGPAFSGRLTSDGSYAAGANIPMGTEFLDTDSAYASGVFTVPSGKAGIYVAAFAHRCTAGNPIHATIKYVSDPGGSPVTQNFNGSFHGTNTSSQAVAVVNAAVGDTIEFVHTGGTCTVDAVGVGSAVYTHGSIYRVASAPE